tara:strand:+ start:21179 stop:21772 length:594 start_codon:yes stop_codon:yes gene_type:complete
MYQYGDHDGAPIGERVAQFRDQVGRRFGGELTEEKFLPLRFAKWPASATPHLYVSRSHPGNKCALYSLSYRAKAPVPSEGYMNTGALLWLIALQVVGSLISVVLLPWLPGPIIGMLLLVIGLLVIGRLPESLERTAAALLKYLPLLLVVPASGIVLSHARLTQDALPIAVALVGSLLVAVPVCGWLFQWLLRRQENR